MPPSSWRRPRRPQATASKTFTGFDTFWYNWIAVNEGSKLLQ